MKKIFFGILAALLMLNSCTLIESESTNRDAVKRYRVSEQKAYDENGDIHMITVYSYSNSGKIIDEENSIYTYGVVTFISNVKYEYDSNENWVKYGYYYNGSDQANFYAVYEYDKDNICTKSWEYDLQDEGNYDEYYYIYEYENELISKTTNYVKYITDTESSLTGYSVSEKNSFGFLTKITTYATDGTSFRYGQAWEFDSNGNVVREVSSSAYYDDEIWEYENEYDSNNNVIRTLITKDDEYDGYRLLTYEEY